MKDKTILARLELLFVMVVFSMVGIFRRHIPLDSLLLASLRALLGAASLYLIFRLGHGRVSFSELRPHLGALILIGIFTGLNWFFLFESYNWTSVPVATVCYYTEPVFVILSSPLIFKEKLTMPKIICVILSFIGVILVSGAATNGIRSLSELKGVFLGLMAGFFYAVVIIWNKTITDIPITERTMTELAFAGIFLLPIALLRGEAASLALMTPSSWIWLLVFGVGYTGVVYAMYYNALHVLPAQTTAFYSYLDPVLAIIFSSILLHERLDIYGIIGSALIVGSALFSDLAQLKKAAAR